MYRLQATEHVGVQGACYTLWINSGFSIFFQELAALLEAENEKQKAISGS